LHCATHPWEGRCRFERDCVTQFTAVVDSHRCAALLHRRTFESSSTPLRLTHDCFHLVTSRTAFRSRDIAPALLVFGILTYTERA
jgi:hypothetical protein